MRRNFLYVEEFCSVVNILIEQGVIGEAYNGSTDEIQILELAKI